MSGRDRTWRSVLVGAVFVLSVCALTTWILVREQAELARPMLQTQHLAQTRTLAQLLTAHWDTIDDALVQSALDTLAAAGTEIVIATGSGDLRIDRRREGRRNPPVLSELRDAIRNGSTTSVRSWGESGPLHLVCAARIDHEGSGAGVVWLARPIEPLFGNQAVVLRLALTLGAMALAATVAFAAILAAVRRRVFHRVIDAARRLAEGDLETPLGTRISDELVALSAALQTLRDRLASQLGLIDRQRRMLETLVDQLREGVIVARGDARIALINPAAIRMLGLQLASGGEDNLVGRTVEAGIPQHALQRLLSGPLLPAERKDAEEDGPNADQRTTPIEVQTRRGTVHLLARASEMILAEPGALASGGAIGRVVVLTDITELQRTIQMRTDFVANASHELRTPLSTIRAAVETLLSMDLATEAPAARQFLAKIDRHSLRLEQMVSDLLDLSRLESPTARFAPEATDCRKVLTELHARFTEALERKNLAWDAQIEPPNITNILVNPQLLRLVLDNLVDNAIKFTEPGGRINVVLRRNGDTAEAEVRDTGCGIPAEEQERVFERFYQVQRARTGGTERGTGLGLSIVKHAVSAMAGSIRLHSASGAGTIVTVMIPQRRPDTN